MMEINKIMIPMDFSDCAVNALRFAKKLALTSKAELLLINVVHQPHVHVEAMGAGAIMQPLMAEYEEQTKKNFAVLVEKEKLDEISYSTKIFHSSFIDAIRTCLDDESIDLIITGTNETHDFLDSILGSKSVDIIENAKIPVLMIPENASVYKVKKIGLAVDFEEHNDLSKFTVTKYFADLLKAEVVILNITENSKKLFLHDDEKVALSIFFNEIDHSFVTINNKGDLVKRLKESGKELGLDMLFMHPKNHGGIESIFHHSKTKSMAMQIDIPLLTVRE